MNRIGQALTGLAFRSTHGCYSASHGNSSIFSACYTATNSSAVSEHVVSLRVSFSVLPVLTSSVIAILVVRWLYAYVCGSSQDESPVNFTVTPPPEVVNQGWKQSEVLDTLSITPADDALKGLIQCYCPANGRKLAVRDEAGKHQAGLGAAMSITLRLRS